MGKISKLIQKIEGYDWENHDFEVLAVCMNRTVVTEIEVLIGQLDETEKTAIEKLVARTQAFSTDKDVFAIVSVEQEKPFVWRVRFAVDSNDNYVPTEDKEDKK